MAVIKTIDLVGVSTESWRDAAQQALAEAAKTIRGIEAMDILETSAKVTDGRSASTRRTCGSASGSSAGHSCTSSPRRLRMRRSSRWKSR